MDPVSIASLALSAAPGLFKGITGLFQRNQDVQRVDTTPAAFTESLALRRQAANSAMMPGYGQRLNQLAQGQAGSVQNATMGAASSGDFLAGSQAADARMAQGQQQLGVQNAQYHDQATKQLEQGLAQQAQYQVADTNRYNMAKAALKGSGLTNLFGGLSDAASAGVYALNKNNATYTGSTPGYPAYGSFGGVDGMGGTGGYKPPKVTPISTGTYTG